jgi:hypothetical protein
MGGAAMTPSENHNRLAHEFVMKVVRETRSHSELMVVVESAVLSAMLVSREVYRLPSAVCVEMIEMAIQQATVRFSAMETKP